MQKDKTAIGKTALCLSAVAILCKVLGFAERIIVANFFGTDDKADVYFASMAIILSLVFLVKELVYPAVLPVFAKALKVSPKASSALFKRLFWILFAALIIISISLITFSDAASAVLVPGFSQQKRGLTSSVLKLLTPGCLFLGIEKLINACYYAITAVADCLDALVRLATHSIATVGLGLSNAINSCIPEGQSEQPTVIEGRDNQAELEGDKVDERASLRA